MNNLVEKRDFLLTFATSPRAELKHLLRVASEKDVIALTECVLNLDLFTSSAASLNNQQCFIKRMRDAPGKIRQVFLKFPENLRRIVARVVRGVLIAEIILLVATQ